MAVRLKEENSGVFAQTEVQEKGSQERRLLSPERGDFAMERKMPGHTATPDPEKLLPLHLYHKLLATGQLEFLEPEEELREFERIRQLGQRVKKEFQLE
jgi:hypothetical protein